MNPFTPYVIVGGVVAVLSVVAAIVYFLILRKEMK